MNKKIKGAGLPIDSNKLTQLLMEEGTMEEVSEELGYQLSTIRRYLENKAITKPMAKLLEAVYGIEYKSYKIDETPKEVTCKQEIEDPTERYLLMILQELKSITEYIGRKK